MRLASPKFKTRFEKLPAGARQFEEGFFAGLKGRPALGAGTNELAGTDVQISEHLSPTLTRLAEHKARFRIRTLPRLTEPRSSSLAESAKSG